MLHRFLSGEPLSPDYFGFTAAPEVVIRQVGESEMQVWDINQGKVMNCIKPSRLLLCCFDPKKSLYLYEPGKSSEEPHFEELSLPIMCSVSPGIRRYKEFEKNEALKFFMPPWTLPELLAVGEFVRKRSPNQVPLSPEDISKRYYEFGGIFSHVFASDMMSIRRNQEVAIQSLDPRLFLLDEIDEERRGVSHFIAQYQVDTEGPVAYRDAHFHFTSDSIRTRVESRFMAMDLDHKVRLLIKSDESPSFLRSLGPRFYEIYEEVVAVRLRQGVCWQKKNLTDSNFSEFILRLTKMVEGQPPIFADMEPDVLYKSLVSTHPAVDMMYKTADGLLYGLQVTTQEGPTKEIATTAVDKWLESIDWRDSMEKVRIAVVPKPKRADTKKKKKPDLAPYLAEKLKVVYEGDGKGYPPLEVWKVPSDYGRSFSFSQRKYSYKRI